ncbi:hypothetical protein [Microbulbifer sp. 2205BS26-8]|uniref:hypothetical protein n=1 Tax=Microbulbifer sp. 2205BS26-8 TaxID=3064386 RepID=UPI00273DEA35|nr:hypothetical protein [Microbulbifer sp. 2205BS26-8]MDP5208901.1 hypothetical protein [Microbulbifer sp. 2205BS26-8]
MLVLAEGQRTCDSIGLNPEDFLQQEPVTPVLKLNCPAQPVPGITGSLSVTLRDMSLSGLGQSFGLPGLAPTT